MKCLSLMQPFATLIVLGAKRFETRSWQTAHRGPLAIHASRRFPAAARALVRAEPFRSLLARAGFENWQQLPTGRVLGTIALQQCTRVEELPDLSAQDHSFGDFGPGRWAWVLTEPRALRVPFPWRGNLGLFDVPDECFQVK